MRAAAAQAFAESMEISATELAKGFARMSDAVDDLSLDVPGAQAKYDALKARAQADMLPA